jgi:hypothetical protein
MTKLMNLTNYCVCIALNTLVAIFVNVSLILGVTQLETVFLFKIIAYLVVLIIYGREHVHKSDSIFIDYMAYKKFNHEIFSFMKRYLMVLLE